MNKKLVVIIVALILLGAGIWLGKDLFLGKTSAKAELRVKSNPTASIFLDAENLGRTPYQDKINPGEYELKLIPEESESLASWEQRIKLESGTETYVNVNLGSSEVNSSWEVLSLEKIKEKETEIAVLSKTEASEVFFDGERKGAVPLSFQKEAPGTHELKLSAPGFAERVIKIKVTRGFKLTVNSQLALLEEREEETAREDQSDKKEVGSASVLIKGTPTGWLRVRQEPSTASQELTKVKPGEKYPLLAEESGWYKIEYEKGKEGWISGSYAEKVE